MCSYISSSPFFKTHSFEYSKPHSLSLLFFFLCLLNFSLVKFSRCLSLSPTYSHLYKTLIYKPKNNQNKQPSPPPAAGRHKSQQNKEQFRNIITSEKKKVTHIVSSGVFVPMAYQMRLNNPKRLTDPFGYVSSGSEHDAVFHHHDEDNESPSLSDLVECFLEEDYACCRNNEVAECQTATDSGSERSEACLNSKRVVSELLNNRYDQSEPNCDLYKRMLESHVQQAIKTLERFGSRDKSTFNRNVMYFLRKLGHNAAICKSKWDSSGGSLAAGSYEFIDVEINTKTSQSQHRYFIDLNFAAEFEIARPTEHYSHLFQSLPKVIVTTEEALKKAIKVVAEEAKRSLKSRDLQLPPWRKNRYMQMKWFGPYKRTTNLFPINSPLHSVNSAVTCTRLIGFEVERVTDDVNGLYSVRTR